MYMNILESRNVIIAKSMGTWQKTAKFQHIADIVQVYIIRRIARIPWGFLNVRTVLLLTKKERITIRDTWHRMNGVRQEGNA